MAGLLVLPEDSEPQQQTRFSTISHADLVSDDDRSIATDSWSIKSEYGSALDDDQCPIDSVDILCTGFSTQVDCSSEKEEPDFEGARSALGLKSYWDSQYANELTKFQEHGHTGELWFGAGVMGTVVSWTKSLCLQMARDQFQTEATEIEQFDESQCLSRISVLDIGTGNGLLLHELAKYGFSDLTGVDYSEDAVGLAHGLAEREGFPNIRFQVDDVLDTKLQRRFKLVLDKGTFDAIGSHPDGPIKRKLYWDAVSKLVAPHGILVITSCNSTRYELMEDLEDYNTKACGIFRYVDHVRTYPTYEFSGRVGSRCNCGICPELRFGRPYHLYYLL